MRSEDRRREGRGEKIKEKGERGYKGKRKEGRREFKKEERGAKKKAMIRGVKSWCSGRFPDSYCLFRLEIDMGVMVVWIWRLFWHKFEEATHHWGSRQTSQKQVRTLLPAPSLCFYSISIFNASPPEIAIQFSNGYYYYGLSCSQCL